ncbi:hypothetical protein EV360DRAFT_41266 [Lentinula raphanica]|nr:hypothetical protein EV360DRAFT_41266 [Lentinula raphanica]
MAFQPAQTGSIPGWKSGSSFAGPSHQSGPSSSIRGPDLGIGREEEHDSKREATPEVGSQESSDKVYQSTPNSNHSNSYAPAVPPGKTYRVDEVNKYLEADFTFIRKLPVEEFAKLTMNLDVNKDDWTLSDSVEAAFKNYLDVVASAANEDDKRVYPALVQLLNAFPNDNITFYCQDPKMIQGSLVLESPDVCGVFKKLAEGGDIHDKEGRVVLWGHLATIVECKVKKGKMVEPDCGGFRQSSQSRTEEISGRRYEVIIVMFLLIPRRPIYTDATAQEERPQKKTLLRPPIIEIEHSSGSWGYTIDPSTGRVLGTVPKRMSPKGARIQKMGYARDILCWGVLRTHVYIVLIDCHLARITYYDHSLLDLTKPSGKLNFAKMVKRLRSMSSEELGLARGMDAGLLTNPLTLQVPKDKKTKTTTEPPSSRLYELDGDSFFTFPYDIDSPGAGQTRIVKLGRVLARSNGVLGRGTTVVRVECACRRNLCCREGCNWAKKKLVMKLLFPGTSRVSEHVFLEECKKLATGDHAWVLNHLPEIYCSFDIAFTDESPQQRLSNALGNTYQMRIVRGMIQEELDPLSSLKTARECAQVFYDVVQCHHWVWTYPKILHRDISQGNIMVRVKDGVTYGVLNDWDLASWVGKPEKGSTSHFRTGTKPYMAHEQHRPKWKGPHRYRHDLESVFYVMTLFTFLYSKPSEKVLDALDEDYQFEKWHQEDDKFLAKTKFNLICVSIWDPPATDFFIGFKQWLTRFHVCFYRGFQNQHNFRLDQFQDPMLEIWSKPQPQPQIQQMQSFNEETLGGFITVEYIVLIMHEFGGEELDTRGAEWQGLLRGLLGLSPAAA